MLNHSTTVLVMSSWNRSGPWKRLLWRSPKGSRSPPCERRPEQPIGQAQRLRP